MSQRVNDLSWFATFEQHLDWNSRSQVNCTSYEQGRPGGRAGVELWVQRHEDRIRREVAEHQARRRKR